MKLHRLLLSSYSISLWSLS